MFKKSNKVDTYSQMINKRISNFQKQMQSTYKSGTTIPLDSAVWDLEALITNYGAFPDSAAKNFTIKKAHFTINVDANSNVTNSDVQALYQQMIDTIDAQLATINSDDKFLNYSDVQKDSVVGSTAYLTTNNGYGSNLILGLYQPFTDSWIWGTLQEGPGVPPMGNCSGTDLTSDGSDEIQYRLNHPAAMSAAIGYTDLETITTNGSFFSDANGNPRLYWDVTGAINHCMDIPELTTNLTNADTIIKTCSYPDPTLGIRPQGKAFIKVNIVDDVITDYYPSIYFHVYHVTYGKPYFYIQ